MLELFSLILLLCLFIGIYSLFFYPEYRKKMDAIHLIDLKEKIAAYNGMGPNALKMMQKDSAMEEIAEKIAELMVEDKK